MIKIGIDTESCHLWLQNKKMDIFGFIDKAKEFGFDGVMINLIEKKNQTEGLGALGKDDPKHIQEVADYLKEKGMYVELATRGTGYEHLKHILDIAEVLGAKNVRTFVMSGGGYSHGNLAGSYDSEAFKKAAEELKQIVPVLMKKRIHLGIENHEIETCTEIVNFVKDVNSPWVGIHFDIGNVMMAWEDPLEAAKKVAPYTVMTHMKDHIICKNGKDGDYVVCGIPMGEGNIDIEAVTRYLYEHTQLTQLMVEMCYPYASPFARPAGTGGVNEVGEGAFTIKDAPFPVEEVKPTDYYLYDGALLEEMMQAQLAGMKKCGEHLKAICRKIEAE